jgi:hypothetical protein
MPLTYTVAELPEGLSGDPDTGTALCPLGTDTSTVVDSGNVLCGVHASTTPGVSGSAVEPFDSTELPDYGPGPVLLESDSLSDTLSGPFVPEPSSTTSVIDYSLDGLDADAAGPAALPCN